MILLRVHCGSQDCVFRLTPGAEHARSCDCVPSGQWVARDDARALVIKCMGFAAELDALGLGVVLGSRVPRLLVSLVERLLDTADHVDVYQLDSDSMRGLREELLRIRGEARVCMGGGEG
jgi:hypothetical protein